MSIVLLALVLIMMALTGARADERTDRLYEQLRTQVNAKLEVQKDKTLKPADRESKLAAIAAKITKLQRLLSDLNEDPQSVAAKIRQWEKAPGAGQPPPEPEYTDSEKSEIARLKQDIKKSEADLKEESDQNSLVARLLKRKIARKRDRLTQIRNAASRRPPKPKPKVIVIRLGLNAALRAAMQGSVATVVKNKVVTRAIKRLRPWKLGKWRSRFRNPKTFDSLQATYRWLQDAMRATLLIKREKWSPEEATDYNSQLASIAARLKFTERQIMFNLARLSPNGPLAKKMAKLTNEWTGLKATEQKIWGRLEAIRKKQRAIMKKHKIKPRSAGASNDWAIREIHRLEAKYRRIAKKEWIPARQDVAKKQGERARLLSTRDKEIKGKAEAYLKLTKSSFKVHKELGKGRSTKIYEQFLVKGKEVDTFYGEATKRYKATKKVGPGR